MNRMAVESLGNIWVHWSPLGLPNSGSSGLLWNIPPLVRVRLSECLLDLLSLSGASGRPLGDLRTAVGLLEQVLGPSGHLLGPVSCDWPSECLLVPSEYNIMEAM